MTEYDVIPQAWARWSEMTYQERVERDERDERLSELDEEWYGLNPELEGRLLDFATNRKNDATT